MSIGEICNREVIVIEKEGSISEVIRLMRDHHVGDVVVVETRNGLRYPVGILTDRDIVVEILAKDIGLDDVGIVDVMSYELAVSGEEDDVIDTVKRMRAKGVRRMPVVNRQGVLIGIVTVDDLIDLIAEQVKDLANLIGNEQKQERRSRL